MEDDAEPKYSIVIKDPPAGTQYRFPLQAHELSALDEENLLQLSNKVLGRENSDLPDLVAGDLIDEATGAAIGPELFSDQYPHEIIYLTIRQTELDQQVVYEEVSFVPHFETLTDSGKYEYVESQGRKALAYALAELIDNSLGATAKNKEGDRKITIKWLVDQDILVVCDNGAGMNEKELKDWATFHKSVARRTKRDSLPALSRTDKRHRFLNSDISFFGVGGKQATFFIGSGTTMITRKQDPRKSVLELLVSKKEFERRDKQKEEVYKGQILIRDRGAPLESHENFKFLIESEMEFPHFTFALIHDLQEQHKEYLQNDKDLEHLCNSLAEIYHYYLHGPEGNVLPSRRGKFSARVDIAVEKWIGSKRVFEQKLWEIDTDLQTRLIRSSKESWEFELNTSEGTVQGVCRYHPFENDHETFPTINPGEQIEDANDDSLMSNTYAQQHNSSVRFQTFWNGRLVSNTDLNNLYFCRLDEKRVREVEKIMDPKVYNRFSCCLFLGSPFEVTSNKMMLALDFKNKLEEANVESLTFLELVVSRGLASWKERRVVTPERVFQEWLQKCHEQYDKQVLFLEQAGEEELLKINNEEAMWVPYNAIKLDKKTIRVGTPIEIKLTRSKKWELAKILKYHQYAENVKFGFGGSGSRAQLQIELVAQGKKQYVGMRLLLGKLCKILNQQEFNQKKAAEQRKLPNHLQLTFPDKKDGTSDHSDDGEVTEGDLLQPDKSIGPCQIILYNRDGDRCATEHSKKIEVTQTVLYQPNGEEKNWITLSAHTSRRVARQEYWFKYYKFQKCGKYQLKFTANYIEPDPNAPEVKEFVVNYKVEAAIPSKISVELETLHNPVLLGDKIKLILSMHDKFGNLVQAKKSYKFAKPKSTIAKFAPQGKLRKLPDERVELCFKVEPKNLQSKKDDGDPQYHAFTIEPQVNEVTASLEIPGQEKLKNVFNFKLSCGMPHKLQWLDSDDPEPVIELINKTKLNLPKFRALDEWGNEGYFTPHSTQYYAMRVSNDDAVVEEAVISRNANGTLNNAHRMIKVNKVAAPQEYTLTVALLTENSLKAVDKSVEPVTAKVILKPSMEPASWVLMGPEGNEIQGPISAEAGSTVSNLGFKVLNEAGDEIPMGLSLVKQMKVTWRDHDKSAKEINALFAKNKLPPFSVNTKHGTMQSLLVSVKDVVALTIDVKIDPGPPHALLATCKSKSVLWGESVELSKGIKVEVQDKYGNKCRSAPKGKPRLTGTAVEVGGLKSAGPTENYHAIIHGFILTGACEKRSLTIEWDTVKTDIDIGIVAGPPKRFRLTRLEMDEESYSLNCYNASRIPREIDVQLLDKGGNTTTYKGKVFLRTSPGLKLISERSGRPFSGVSVDKEGVAHFGYADVVADENTTYDIEFLLGESSHRGEPLSPKLELSVSADPFRPAAMKAFRQEQNKLVGYEMVLKSKAGEKIPDIFVRLLTEQGNYLEERPQKSDIILVSKRTDGLEEVKTQPSKEPGPHNSFHFKDLAVPQKAGRYIYEFHYQPKGKLRTQKIEVESLSGDPEKIMACANISKLAVTNEPEDATLLNQAKFMLVDRHGNPVTDPSYNFNVQVQVLQTSNDVPVVLTSPSPICNGSFEVTAGVKPNTSGADGQYTLRITPVTGPKSMIKPFDIQFYFSNDANKRKRNAELLAQRQVLEEVIKKEEGVQRHLEQQLSDERRRLNMAQADKKRIQADIVNSIPRAERGQLQTIEGLDTVINRQQDQLRELTRQRQEQIRDRTLVPLRPDADNDLLGHIGNLGFVEDPDACRMLSHHIQSKLKVIVTRSRARATALSRDNFVLSMETASLARNRWPLPCPAHISKFGGDYLLNFVTFKSGLEDVANQVFDIMVGKALLFPTMEAGLDYRAADRRSGSTIYTRDGQKIDSTGVYGGGRNSRIRQLHDRGFLSLGVPPSSAQAAVTDTIASLRNLRREVETVERAKRTYRELEDKLNPALREARERQQNAVRQKETLDKELGTQSNHANKRTRVR